MAFYYHYKCNDCNYPFFAKTRECPKCKKLVETMEFRCRDCEKVFWDDTGGYCPNCGSLASEVTSPHPTN